jgi:hypothetical protein
MKPNDQPQYMLRRPQAFCVSSVLLMRVAEEELTAARLWNRWV